MVLKSRTTADSSVSVAAEHPQFTSDELQLAEVYAVNATLEAMAPQDSQGCPPRSAEDLNAFRPRRWVVEAIATALYDLRHGLQPVLGQPNARHIPTEAVPEYIALVAEGRDLGLLTESRMVTDATTAVYARAAIKALDEAVLAAYRTAPYNVAPQAYLDQPKAEPMADTIQPPEDMTAFKEYTPQQVADAVNVLVGFCHGNMVDAGWWNNPSTGEDPRNNPLCFSNKLMLVVSEVSEAMEGDRKSLPDDKLPHLPMRDVELADALIRIADMAGAFDLQLARSVVEKMVFNRRRKDHTHAGRLQSGGKAY